MRTIASMFDSRRAAEDAIERLVAARCPRDAITFLPETELLEIAWHGAYDWRTDRAGLWRGLATFDMMSAGDRYALAEGMHRGGTVLLVATRDDTAELYGAVLVEAGAVDLDQYEKAWRESGWQGFADPTTPPTLDRRRPFVMSRLRLY